jgi:protein involved in polysaccharide export with SLBB domain
MIEGAVVRPGSYPYNPQLRAFDYIAIAGGPGKMAQDTDTFRLVSPRGKTISIDNKTFVHPGDTLVVPERHFSRAEVTQIIISAISLAIMTTSVAIVATK